MTELLVVATVLVLVADAGVNVMVKAAGVPKEEKTELDAVEATLLLDVTVVETNETIVEVEMETAVVTLTLLYVGTEVMLVLGEICNNVGLVL